MRVAFCGCTLPTCQKETSLYKKSQYLRKFDQSCFSSKFSILEVSPQTNFVHVRMDSKCEMRGQHRKKHDCLYTTTAQFTCSSNCKLDATHTHMWHHPAATHDDGCARKRAKKKKPQQWLGKVKNKKKKKKSGRLIRLEGFFFHSSGEKNQLMPLPWGFRPPNIPARGPRKSERRFLVMEEGVSPRGCCVACLTMGPRLALAPLLSPFALSPSLPPSLPAVVIAHLSRKN